ncbi:metallophosphoesterase [Megalodesulfovibrio paquesii]
MALQREDPTRRRFVIGDIHGRQDRLQRLLRRLGQLERADDAPAQLIFLGDYVNKGPQTREVLETLLTLRQMRPDTVFLLGNHEAALLRYDETRDAEDLRYLRVMGFQATLDSYGAVQGPGLSPLPESHRTFLRQLAPCCRMPGYLFFHGALPAEIDPCTAEFCAADLGTLEAFLARRQVDAQGWAERHARTGETLVFGHVPLATPLVAPGLIGLETMGDTNDGLLTALELPALRFHQV